MKRKVIQLAGKTCVVSLPSVWVKKFGVKKGDELEIVDRGNELVVRVGANTALRRTTVDLSSADKRVSRLILSSLHRRGFDEIEVLGGSKEKIDEINSLMKDVMLGFVVVEQTSKKCLYKNVYVDVEVDFNNLLRRTFLLTIKIVEETNKSIKESNFSDIKYILDMEMENNKLTNFCERILCKSLYSTSELTPFYFIVVWNLEKIADQYKYICDLLSGKEHKLDLKIVELAELVLKALNDFYTLYYNFGFDKITDLNSDIKEVTKKYSLITFESHIDNNVLFYLLGVLDRIKDFFTSVVPVNVE